jgi:hypothetical protein
MSDGNFLNKISSTEFDVAYVDVISPYPCSLILPYNLSIDSIPYVSYIAVAVPWHIGIPALPSFVPAIFSRPTR